MNAYNTADDSHAHFLLNEGVTYPIAKVPSASACDVGDSMYDR